MGTIFKEPTAKKSFQASYAPKAVPSFAKGLNFYKLFWIFFIGCFLGVVVEVLWCLLTRHHYESRQGLIYGPFNPVYGFGALAMTLSLYWLRRKRDSWIFLGGVVIGGAFEYLCSWVQEVLFGTVSWDYGEMPFNLNGRINLLYSIFWGILALLWLKTIFPLMERWIERIPNRIGKTLTWILFAFMVVNIVVSACAVARMSQRHRNIPASGAVDVFLDEHYGDERLNKIYPNMMFVKSGGTDGAF